MRIPSTRFTLSVPAVLLLLAAPPPASAGIPTPHARRLPAKNVHFLSRIDDHDRYSDIWGYTAPDGREFAIAGVSSGLSFIDITNPRRAFEVKFVSRPSSQWRDIKTYDHYAYCVNENRGGLGIIDLSDPADPTLIGAQTSFTSAHNLYIDEAAALAFVAGSAETPGVRIFSLADPAHPTLVASWATAYAHDVFARDGRMYVSAIQDRALYIVDISNLQSMTLLGSISNYPDAFTHNAWPTEDGTHVMTTDERSGAFIHLWDVTDPATQKLADRWWPLGAARAIPHNAIIEGDLAYISYYTVGVWVLDLSDPTDIRDVAWFDTLIGHNWPIFDGCWGVFPFFPNSPGRFVCSDISNGVFVLDVNRAVLGPTGGAPAVSIDEAGSAIGFSRNPPRAGVSLGPAFPNPVREGAGVSADLSLPTDGVVWARVHDATGRVVRELANRSLPAGRRTLHWDGRTGAGGIAAPGVYFLRVQVAGRSDSRRITVLH